MKTEQRIENPDYIVNINDLAWPKFWKHNYMVHITSQGISFLVNADCEAEALDYIMDFIVDAGLVGLYSTDDEDIENGDYITAGNCGYKFTTYNICIEEV